MKASRFFVPAIFVVVFASPVVHARTWTAASSGRTVDGDFVKVDGAHVIIKRASGKTSKLPIAMLSKADQAFIKERSKRKPATGSAAPASQKSTGGATGPFQQLKPPVTLKVTPITGKEKKRKASIEAGNDSGRKIEKLEVALYFLKKDGSVDKDVPHTHSGLIEKGKTHTIQVTSFFMEDDTASIDGVVSSLEFADGSKWPAMPAKPPAQKGDEPVAAAMLGVLGSGEKIKPAVACFNRSAKAVKGVNYRIEYLDADGKVLKSTGYGYRSDKSIMKPGKGKVIAGGKGPPKGAAGVRIKMKAVTFVDDTTWSP